MKLDRNIAGNKGRGKYAIINLRKLSDLEGRQLGAVLSALNELEELGILEWGAVGDPNEFFLIKLKDQCARAALRAYAREAAAFDPEWSDEVSELAGRSGRNHPLCKLPD